MHVNEVKDIINVRLNKVRMLKYSTAIQDVTC